MPQVTVVRGGDDGENSAHFQLIDGKLHLPTIGSFFGLVPSSMRLDGTVHASDGSGLTFLTFQDGQTITVVGDPAQIPLSVQSVPPPCRVLLVYTLQTTSKRGPNILDTHIPTSSYNEHQGEAPLRQHGRSRDNHDHVPGGGDAQVAEADDGFNNKRRKLQAAEDDEEELLGTWTLPSNHTTAAFADLEHQVQELMIGNAVLVNNCQFMYRYYGSTLPIRSTAALQEAISHFRSLMSCTMAVDDLMQQCRIYVSPKPATSRSASQLCLPLGSSVISLTPSSSSAGILNPAAAPPPPLLLLPSGTQTTTAVAAAVLPSSAATVSATSVQEQTSRLVEPFIGMSASDTNILPRGGGGEPVAELKGIGRQGSSTIMAAMKAAPSAAGEAVAVLSQSQQQAAGDHTSLPVLLPVLMEVRKEALQTQLAGSANTQQGGTSALNAGTAELDASVLSAVAALTPNPDDINPVTSSVIFPASFSAATSSALSFSAATLNQMMALSSTFSSSTQPAIMKIIPENPAAIPTVKPDQSLQNETQLVSSDAQLLHLKGSIDIADESGSIHGGALSGLAIATGGQAATGASSSVAPRLQPLLQDYLSGALLPAMNSSGSISLSPFQNIPISQLRQPSISSGTTSADITAAAADAANAAAAAPGTSDKAPVVPAADAAPGTSDKVPVVHAAAAAAQQILNILPVSVVDAAAVLSSSGSVSVPSGLLLQLISNYQLTQQQQQQQQPPVAANAANIRDGEASSAAAAMTLNKRQSSTPLLQQVHQVGRPGSAAAAAATPASPAVAAADVPAEWSLIQSSVSKQPYHHAALPPQQSQRGGEFIRQQHFMSAAAAAAAGGVLGRNYSRQNEGEDLQEGIDHYADEGGLDIYGGGQAGEAGALMTKGKSKESKTRYADGRFKDEERHLKKMEEMHLRCSELFEGRITHLITVLDHKSLRCEACPEGGSLIKAYSAYHIDAVRKHFLRHHESLLKQGGVCPDNYRKEYEMPAKMRRAVATTTRSSSSPMISNQPHLHPSGGNQTAASGFGSAAPSPAAPQFLLDKLYLTSYASINQPLGYQQPSDHLGSAFHGNAMRSSDHDHDGEPDGPSYFHHQHTEHQQQRRLHAPAEPKKRQAAAAAGHALQQEILDQMYLTSYASRGTSTTTAAEAAPGAHPEAVRRYSGSSYSLSGSEPMAAAVPARVSNAGNPSLFDQLYEYACDPLTPASALHQPLPEVPMSAVQSVPEHFGTHYEPQQQQHRETYGTEHLFDLVDAMAQLPPDPLRDRLVNDLYFDSYAAGAASAAPPASTPSTALVQSTQEAPAAAMASSSAPRSSSSQLINDIYFKSYAAGHLAGLEAAAGTHTAAGSGRLPAAAAGAAGSRATQSGGPLSMGLRAYPGHAAPLSVATSSNRHLSQLHSNSSSWVPDPPSFVHPSSVIRAAADALGAAQASSSRTGPATGGAGNSSASDAALVLHPTDEVIISQGPANHDARPHASASEAPEQWGRLLDVAPSHDVSAEDAALMESLGI